jgi:hypothetical protein
VKLEVPPLHEAVVHRHYTTERKIKLLSLKALMASSIPTPEAGKMADQFLRDVQNLIFPEMGPAKEEFSKTSKDDMDFYRGKVIEISENTATIKDNADVADEIMENVESVRQATASRRSRRMLSKRRP